MLSHGGDESLEYNGKNIASNSNLKWICKSDVGGVFLASGKARTVIVTNYFVIWGILFKLLKPQKTQKMDTKRSKIKIYKFITYI